MVLLLNKIESPSPKDALWQICKWFLRTRFFLNFVNGFLLFRNYLPLEKGRALHLKKLESRSPKDALFQVWLKLVQWFLRRRFFFYFVNVFLQFRIFLPLEMGAGALHLKKLESRSPKDSLCQVWLKLTQWFWRRR